MNALHATAPDNARHEGSPTCQCTAAALSRSWETLAAHARDPVAAARAYARADDWSAAAAESVECGTAAHQGNGAALATAQLGMQTAPAVDPPPLESPAVASPLVEPPTVASPLVDPPAVTLEPFLSASATVEPARDASKLPPESPAARPPRTSTGRRWKAAAAVTLLLVLPAAVYGALRPLDHLVLSPTPPEPVQVRIAGAEARADGAVFMIGLVRQWRPRGVQWLLARRHPWHEVAPAAGPPREVVETAVLPNDMVSSKLAEFRYDPTLQLEHSKLAASFVAARAADKQAQVSGDGVAIVDGGSTQLRAGDIVTHAGGRAVGSPLELQKALGRAAGEQVRLATWDGRSLPVAVPRGSAPLATLGLVTTAAGMQVSTRPALEFGELADVVGASAGLALALAAFDQLKPGVLPSEGRIVATGALTVDGQVDDVTGVSQKARAAAQAGADLLVVPEGNLEAACRFSGPVPVIAVSTFEQALRRLETRSQSDCP